MTVKTSKIGPNVRIEVDSAAVATITADQWDAIRNYVIARRDQALGRWRTDPTSGFVVYPDGPDLVTVIRETDGRSATFARGEAPTTQNPAASAAARYFAAHPSPKPWESATPGSVWEFTAQDSDEPAAATFDGTQWRWTTGRVVNLATLVSGRQVYPLP